MPHLKTEPAGTLATLDQLFALADAMERAAAERYGAFAAAMREQGRLDLADVFEAIAVEESQHVEGVAAWSSARTGHRPDPRQLPWPALPTFEPDDEAAITGSASLTPYRALSIAVRNEERAFVLWSYLAANAPDAAVRDAAERMAMEELNHVAVFRRARREAFHRERDAPVEWMSATQIESRLDDLLRAQAGPSTGAKAGGRAIQDDAGGTALPAASATVRLRVSPTDSPLQLAERLADAYLDAAARCTGDTLMNDLQRLASRAVHRLAALRSRPGPSAGGES